MRRMRKDDIEGLKQRLFVYKQTLETMKSGHVVEDYLFMKSECYNLIKQISKLASEIKTVKNKQEDQITNFNQQVDFLNEEIKSINLTLENVKQEVKTLTDKVNSLNLDEMMLKIQTMMRNEAKKEKNELLDLKNEINKLKSEVFEPKRVIRPHSKNVIPKIQLSSYQQLRSIINSSLNGEKGISTNPVNIQLIPNEIGNINIKRKIPKGPYQDDSENEEVKQDKPLNNLNQYSINTKNTQESTLYDTSFSEDHYDSTNQNLENKNNPSEDKQENETSTPNANREIADGNTSEQIYTVTDQLKVDDVNSEKVDEEKSSFFSFLQKGKYFGK